MLDFSDRVVLVTGAAGNLGRALVHAFQAAGARLVLVDRAPDRLQELFPDLANSLDHFLATSVDLIKSDVVQSMVEKAIDRLGRIDVLVNAAGGFRAGKMAHQTPWESWDFLLKLNALTVINTASAVVPHMVEQGGGRIINVAAEAALEGGAKMAPYSVSKSAVIRLTESMAAELGQNNIHVNCILPSIIDTPENRKAMPKANFDRWVKPEAIADVVLFLASDAARAIQGAAIPVHGKT